MKKLNKGTALDIIAAGIEGPVTIGVCQIQNVKSFSEEPFIKTCVYEVLDNEDLQVRVIAQTQGGPNFYCARTNEIRSDLPKETILRIDIIKKSHE